jgi:hypothetical protein
VVRSQKVGHVTPVAGTLPRSDVKKGDPVGYERSMESLLEEPQERNEIVKSLIKVTFEKKKWVCLSE